MTIRNPLFLGNSHTAAARIALRDNPDRWPDFQPDVFAMPAELIGKLDLVDRCFQPRGDEVRRKMVYWNGIPDLPVSGYDAFVVFGGLSFGGLAGLQDTHRSLDFPSVMAGASHQPVSTGLIDAMLAHRIADSAALHLIRALASLGQGPVLFVDTVFPSVECRQEPGEYASYVEMAGRGDGEAYHARYLRLLRDALGHDAERLGQPEATVVEGVFTAPEWMRGSIRMQPRRDVPHEAAEYGHANPAYGALQVDQVVEALARL